MNEIPTQSSTETGIAELATEPAAEPPKPPTAADLMKRHAADGGDARALVKEITRRLHEGDRDVFNQALHEAAEHGCKDVIVELNQQVTDPAERTALLNGFCNHVPKEVVGTGVVNRIIGNFKDVLNNSIPSVGSFLMLGILAEQQDKGGVLDAMIEHGARVSYNYVELERTHLTPIRDDMRDSLKISLAKTNERKLRVIDKLERALDIPLEERTIRTWGNGAYTGR